MFGQGHEAGLLPLEGLAHCQLVILGPTPVCRWAITPKLGLRIEVVHIGEATCGEEVVPDVADGALHPTLLVATCNGHGSSFEAVMRGKCQILRVEAYGWTYALQVGIPVDRDRSFRFVVTGDSGLS